MALKITSSAYYFHIPSLVFDKVTEEFDPPSYWFRLKVSAKGKQHQKCLGHLSRLWHGNHRRVRNFDPLVMYWINEPPPVKDGSGSITQTHYQVDISSGHSELAGLMHVKLPSSFRSPDTPPPPEGNIPADQLPDIRIDKSKNESNALSKVTTLSYGTYYIEANISDAEGNTAKKIFKIWAFPDPKKCKIRSSRWYERFFLSIKSLLKAL